jgi:multiple sugar transport system ATP-binding protein
LDGPVKLKVANVTRVFPDGTVGVKGIDLSVDDGQMAVILGPSGCGKTTLLRLIAGLEAAGEGKIILEGVDITAWEPKKRDVAMVFQNYALYPHMTVRQNLEFGLRARNTDRGQRDRAVDWAAGLLGLEDHLHRRPAELSGGQRQRVALGRAIVRKPKLYLFDEPLSNLDAELRMRMRGEILSLHRQVNGTSLYVTHDQVEAMSLADVVFIIRGGEIVSSGSPRELYENPPDVFTAGFLGFPSMNLVPGSLVDGEFRSSGGLSVRLERSVPGVSRNRENLVMGIRPEEVVVSDDGTGGEIVSTEDLGSSVMVLVKISEGDMIKVVTRRRLQAGSHVMIAPDQGKIMLFDGTTGERLF